MLLGSAVVAVLVVSACASGDDATATIPPGPAESSFPQVYPAGSNWQDLLDLYALKRRLAAEAATCEAAGTRRAAAADASPAAG
jgi:hypothetical protein